MRMYFQRWLWLPNAVTSMCEHVSVCFCLCVCMRRRCAAHVCGKNNRFSFHPFIHVSMLTTFSPLPNAMLAKRARGKIKLIEIENEWFLRILRENCPRSDQFFGRYILFYCFIHNILFLLSTLIGIHMKSDVCHQWAEATEKSNICSQGPGGPSGSPNRIHNIAFSLLQ